MAQPPKVIARERMIVTAISADSNAPTLLGAAVGNLPAVPSGYTRHILEVTLVGYANLPETVNLDGETIVLTGANPSAIRDFGNSGRVMPSAGIPVYTETANSVRVIYQPVDREGVTA